MQAAIKVAAWTTAFVAALAAVVAAHQSSATPPRVPASKTLTCGEVNGFIGTPSKNTRIVLGRVALPPERFPSAPHYSDAYGSSLPYYGKFGLEARAGRSTEIVIPRSWRTRVALGWGEDHPPIFASVIHVPRCPPVLGRRWLVWAGGYFLGAPACITVIVRAGVRSARVRLGIGRRCSRR